MRILHRLCFLFLLGCAVMPLQGMIRMNHEELHNAIKKGNVSVVEEELDKLADINQCINSDHNSLHIAVCHQKPAIVELLIQRNIDVNKQEEPLSGRTALHMAVWTKHKAIVQLLLNAGANLNIKDQIGQTPLDIAIFCHDKSMIDQLIDAGSLFNNTWTLTLLHHHNDSAKIGHTAQKILERGFNPFFSSMDRSFVMQTIYQSKNGLRKREHYIFLLPLCSKTARLHPYFMNDYTLDARNKIHSLLIEYAFMQNWIYGALTRSNWMEKTIPHLLAENDFSWLSDDWLGKNPTSNNIDVQDELGATLLMYAAAAGNVDAVTWLLRHNAHVLLRTKHHENVFDIVMQIMQNMQLDHNQTVAYKIILRLCYQVLITEMIRILPGEICNAPQELFHKMVTSKIGRNDLSQPQYQDKLLPQKAFKTLIEAAQEIKNVQMVPVMVGVAMGGNEVSKPDASVNKFPDNLEIQVPHDNPITPATVTTQGNAVPLAAIATPCSWKKYSIGTAGIVTAALYALYTHYSAPTTTESSTNVASFKDKLINLLASKNYQQAYDLVHAHAATLQALSPDEKTDIAALIYQAEMAIQDQCDNKSEI